MISDGHHGRGDRGAGRVWKQKEVLGARRADGGEGVPGLPQKAATQRAGVEGRAPEAEREAAGLAGRV